jgi:diguanylate cyclase (GGDEF)-like protein
MRVLIADDEPTSRLVLKAMVSRLGHECVLAEDGDQAWEILAASEIDVLLTDWMMPGVDGPELCRRARHERDGRYVYVVLITALESPDQVLQGMGAGADDYLVKPVDGLVLQTRLVAAERVTALHRQVAHFQAQLEQANQVLLGQSLTDPLTGLGNRRRIEQDQIRVHERSVRSGRPYGLAMFDVDYFKLYNDHYGHLAGDDVLRRVAHEIEQATRSGEVAYRFGGEEFLLIADGGEAEAAAAAERICRAIEAADLPHAARPTAPPVVTVSAGISAWDPGTRATMEEVLDRADHALFEAKSYGRNRVVRLTPTGFYHQPA